MTPPTTTRMSSRPSARQFLDDLGDQRLVAAGQRGDAEHVHVVLDGVPRHLLRRLEQRADVHVEAEVGERGGDDLRAAVVAVLAHLGDQDPERPALLLRERGGHLPRLLELGVRLALGRVDAGDRAVHRLVAAEDLLERRRRSRRASRGCAPRPRPGRAGCPRRSRAQRVSASSDARDGRGVARPLQLVEAQQLLAPHLDVVHLEDVDRRSSARAVLVDADDRLLARVDARLAPGGRLLDPHLRQAALDRLRHPAEFLDLLDQRPGPRHQLARSATRRSTSRPTGRPPA